MNLLRAAGFILLLLGVLYVAACTIGAGFRKGFWDESRSGGSVARTQLGTSRGTLLLETPQSNESRVSS